MAEYSNPQLTAFSNGRVRPIADEIYWFRRGSGASMSYTIPDAASVSIEPFYGD